jgi:signal transduction histidine kinase
MLERGLPPMSGPKKILVIDRDPNSRTIFEPLLIAGGCEIVGVVATAEEAVERMGPVPAELVLFAIDGSDWRERLVEARSLKQRLAVPMVFLLDAGADGLMQDAGVLGPLSYVLKPVKARELWLVIDAVRRVHALETRLRQLEAKMQEAQRLEGIGVMAGGIAHDFNNLLTGIFGAVAIARQEVAPGSPVIERLDQIDRTATRAADLCQRLIVHAGRGSVSSRLLSVDGLVEETVRLAHSGLHPDIALQTGLAGNLQPVQAEEAPLRQVVANLVANSAEAIGDAAGVIRVVTFSRQMDRAALAQLQFAQEATAGEFVVIEVADTGCGMSSETMTRIFDPVFTTKSSGRGLGLAAVARIVRKFGGGIHVESSHGRGAVFRVFLPAGRTPAQPSGAAAAGQAVPGGGTILIVDDDEAVRALAEWVVERAGYRVATARDGDEALRLFRADPGAYRLVLLDLTMPRVSGAETLAGLRAVRPNVPVIIITGHGEDALGDDQAGVTAYMQKPFGPDTLRAILHRHVPIARG